MLNLGILAHVDAGKTTLTERLLHAAGVIDEIGRVDDGTTQTDSLALERQRGITIKSAVVSFVVDGVTINLIDTPGHPDFIAEVERVLGVLDGAVLVVSAVEGVQPQTLLLYRALRRLRRADDRLRQQDRPRRRGRPSCARRHGAAARRAGPGHGHARVGVGTTRASVAAHDLAIRRDRRRRRGAGRRRRRSCATTSTDAAARPSALRRALVEQTARLQVLPVYLGAALDRRRRGRPAARDPASCCRRATVTPTGRRRGRCSRSSAGRASEKIAFVRMFAGTLHTRDRLRLGGDADDRRDGDGDRRLRPRRHRAGASRRAGEIAKVHGLTTARIGDASVRRRRSTGTRFAAPALETAIVPRHRRDKRAVFDALGDLAEQDPLIDLRQDDARQELFLSLYGEVQKEIVAQTLLDEYGLEIEFRPTTPVCIERPNRHRGGARAAAPPSLARPPVARHRRAGPSPRCRPAPA